MSKNRFSANGEGKRPLLPPSPPPEEQVAGALDNRFDQINELWKVAEAKLRRQYHIPVDVSICYKSVDEYHNGNTDEPTGAQQHSLLGFVKTQGGWRICFGSAHDAYPQYETVWKPITDCTLDFRVEAIPHLPKLREAVANAARDCIPQLDMAIAELRGIVERW